MRRNQRWIVLSAKILRVISGQLKAAGGVFGGSEPIQQLVKQFEGSLDAAHAAAEVGLETANFLQRIRENSTLQNVGLLVLGVENGSIKRDAWESEFGTMVSVLELGKHVNPPPMDPFEGVDELNNPMKHQR